MASKPKIRKTAPVKKKATTGDTSQERIPLGEVLQDMNKIKWRIGPAIGKGGFGVIYSACQDGSSIKEHAKYPYVVKIELRDSGPLFVEMHFYMRNGKSVDIDAFKAKQKLKSLGMPLCSGNGSHEYKGRKYRFLVLDRFGQDLWSLFLANKRRFPPHTVYRLGVQMLDVLQYIHERGYVHADIKGANILLGLSKATENQAYLLDYGLASRYTDKEYKYDAKKAHNGTIEYTSRDAHMGVPTRRGDLEILAYNLVQWMCGSLPWEKNLKDQKNVQAQKEKHMEDIPAFMKACFKGKPPGPLVSFLEYIKTMKYDTVPDYDKCKKILEAGIKSCGKATGCNLDFKGGSSKNTLDGPDSDPEVDDESEPDTTPIKAKKKRSRSKSKVPKQNFSEVPNSVSEVDDEIESDTTSVKAKKKRPTSKSKVPTQKSSEVPNSVSEVDDESESDTTSVKAKKKRPTSKSKVPTQKSSEVPNGENVKVVKKVTRVIKKVRTPKMKKNTNTIATQTSLEKAKRLSAMSNGDADSSITESVILRRTRKNYCEISDSGSDFIDVTPERTTRKRRAKLESCADEEYTAHKTVKTKVTPLKTKASFKNFPTIVNGCKPPI